MLIIYYYVRDFFLFIGDTVGAIFDLILKLFEVLGECADFLISIASSLPAMFYVFFIALIAISVIYKILGREGATD